MMFRVAQASHSSLDEVRTMTVPDYDDWCAFCIVEPSDGVTLATYFGEIIATLYNVNRDSKTRPEPFTAKDFFRAASEELPVCYQNDNDRKAHDDKQNKEAFQKLMEALK